jgi:hypothetical protein
MVWSIAKSWVGWRLAWLVEPCWAWFDVPLMVSFIERIDQPISLESQLMDEFI